MQSWGRMLRCAAIAAAAARPAAAQEITGAITGMATDAHGRPLPGVVVRAADARTSFAREVTTTSHGTYAATLLPPGRYDVSFAADGLPGVAVHGVSVHVNDRLVVNAVLGPAD